MFHHKIETMFQLCQPATQKFQAGELSLDSVETLIQNFDNGGMVRELTKRYLGGPLYIQHYPCQSVDIGLDRYIISLLIFCLWTIAALGVCHFQ